MGRIKNQTFKLSLSAFVAPEKLTFFVVPYARMKIEGGFNFLLFRMSCLAIIHFYLMFLISVSTQQIHSCTNLKGCQFVLMSDPIRKLFN